jgi:hypothetical protein
MHDRYRISHAATSCVGVDWSRSPGLVARNERSVDELAAMLRKPEDYDQLLESNDALARTTAVALDGLVADTKGAASASSAARLGCTSAQEVSSSSSTIVSTNG